MTLKTSLRASEDPTLRRPYRVLVSAIIRQALKDLHNPDLEAQAWLESPMCQLMLEALGLEAGELAAAIGRAREKSRGCWGAQGPGGTQGRAGRTQGSPE